MMNNKVLVISYYWPPSGGAGVQRWTKFCKYLTQFNVEPIVLTVSEDDAAYPVIDNTFEGDVPSSLKVFKTKARNYYNFYKRFQKEKNVPQGGVPSNQSNWKSKVSLFLRNHLFVPDPRRGWNSYALKEARRVIKEYGIKTIVTTSPPHSTQLIGLTLKKEITGLKWVADLRDPWTDIYYYKDLNHSWWSDRKNRMLEQKVLQNADVLTVVSPGMQRLFTGKGVDEEKVKVVPNGFDHTDFPEVLKQENGNFTMSYIGTANTEYKMDRLFKALQAFDVDNGNLVFNVVGWFDDDVKSDVVSAGIRSIVNYAGYLPHNEAISYTKSADLLVLVIPKVANNSLIYSGKLFEYIASGKPILCIGPLNGDAANLIGELGVGKTFDYEDGSGMHQFLKDVKNGSFMSSALNDEKIRLKYSRKNLSEKMAEILLNG